MVSPLMDCGKVIENFLWKGLTILDATWIIHDSWEEVRTNINKSLRKLIPVIMDDFSGGSNCRCDGNSKRARTGAPRWAWIAAAPDQTWADEERLLTGSKENVSEVDSVPGKDVKIVDMTTKVLFRILHKFR